MTVARLALAVLLLASPAAWETDQPDRIIILDGDTLAIASGAAMPPIMNRRECLACPAGDRDLCLSHAIREE